MNKKILNYLNILYIIANDVEPIKNSKMVASIIYKNNIISIGINQRKTHPFQKKYANNKYCLLHAEISAIKKALNRINLKELSKSTLYVCRRRKTGWGLAKPCNGCALAIYEFNIKNVFYSTNQTNKYEKL